MQARHRGASRANQRLGKDEDYLLDTPAPVVGFYRAWGLRVQCFFQASGSLLPGSRGQSRCPREFLGPLVAGQSSESSEVTGPAGGVAVQVL
ncbi:hypothetical protein NDU88_004667 [Pleurodeles waltl]|uniref:Uncharacterized protein n=1 Tax=Pleurodeles waltl TaxID=8319 RepID=A0AAV7MX16_PLEWA|nr:hypothetical protein NDU88_004667 [Pleurodeles waltl]